MNDNTTAPYQQVYQLSVSVGLEQAQLVTKPGLISWSQVAPSSYLFYENAIVKAGDTILLFGCHLGPLAVSLRRKIPSLHLLITDFDHTALEMTRLTIVTNHTPPIDLIADCDLPHELSGRLNVIYIQLPKGRMLARRWLVQAFKALKLEGHLYLGGANDTGIQSAIKDAQELFGNGMVLAYKKGNRIAQFIKSSDLQHPPEWSHAFGVAPGSWVEFTVSVKRHTFQILSLPGVFSYDHLDEGTEMLLNSVQIARDLWVLDVGCGYGVIGLYAAAEGAQHIDLTDNNLLAIAASKATIAINHIANARVFAGDMLEPVASNKYNLILSNPPFHTGRSVNYQMAKALIAQSYQALFPDGQLILVANRFLRYERLIEAVFGNASTLAESGKFHVLSGLKSR